MIEISNSKLTSPDDAKALATVTQLQSGNSSAVQKALQGVKVKENKQTLTQDDFLKLLTVQLQNQDPLKPMEDAQFMGTMAQFASLEQTRELGKTMDDFTKSMGDFTKSQVLNSAQIYLGRAVTLDVLDPATNKYVVGTVSGVKVADGVPQITVGGKDYATTSVLEIKEVANTATK
jgi:flagellar basal-body rod modification protein FlgD